MSVALAPGKFAAVKMFVLPVMIGSPVATPNVTVGTICVPFTEVVQEFTWVKLIPKFTRCEVIEYVKFVLPCLSGVLRRVWPVVRNGFVVKVKLGAYPFH